MFLSSVSYLGRRAALRCCRTNKRTNLELAEEQHAVPLLLQAGQELVEEDQLAGVLDEVFLNAPPRPGVIRYDTIRCDTIRRGTTGNFW